jgi:hypothetical protein
MLHVDPVISLVIRQETWNEAENVHADGSPCVDLLLDFFTLNGSEDSVLFRRTGL